MAEFILKMSEIEKIFVEIAIIACDLIGVSVLFFTVIRGVRECFLKNSRVKIRLAQGIALALEFKLGGEVLRTVTVRNWNELAILGAIIALRAAIALLIHWEIKMEHAEENAEKANGNSIL